MFSVTTLSVACLVGFFGQGCLHRCLITVSANCIWRHILKGSCCFRCECSQHGHCSPFTGTCTCEQVCCTRLGSVSPYLLMSLYWSRAGQVLHALLMQLQWGLHPACPPAAASIVYNSLLLLLMSNFVFVFCCSACSESSSVSVVLVILLGVSVLVNALLTCALSYSSQKARTRY